MRLSLHAYAPQNPSDGVSLTLHYDGVSLTLTKSPARTCIYAIPQQSCPTYVRPWCYRMCQATCLSHMENDSKSAMCEDWCSPLYAKDHCQCVCARNLLAPRTWTHSICVTRQHNKREG